MYPSYNKNMQAHSGHSSSSSSFLAKHPTQTFMYVLVSNEQNLHHTLRFSFDHVTSNSHLLDLNGMVHITSSSRTGFLDTSSRDSRAPRLHLGVFLVVPLTGAAELDWTCSRRRLLPTIAASLRLPWLPRRKRELSPIHLNHNQHHRASHLVSLSLLSTASNFDFSGECRRGDTTFTKLANPPPHPSSIPPAVTDQSCCAFILKGRQPLPRLLFAIHTPHMACKLRRLRRHCARSRDKEGKWKQCCAAPHKDEGP